MRRLSILFLLAASAFAQAPPTAAKQAPAGPPKPAPRHADGRIDFSGLWHPADIFLIEDISLGLKPGETVPVNAQSVEIMKEHLSKDDPEASCLPTGVPRQAPYPWKFVESPQYIYMLFEGNIHSFRQVFMDGRAHPADPNPTWYGHSVGHWDNDTLIIDTVGFNDRFWFDFVGHPHTEQLHTVERYTRPELAIINEEVTITDPGAYTRPFTINSKHRLLPGDELLEYICQENQRDTPHLIGPAEQALMRELQMNMRAHLVTAALLTLSGPISAQWFDYPTKGIPRLPDGKANMTAPVPKTADGKLDLSGVWLGDQWSPAGRRPNPPGAGRGGGGRGGGAPEMLPWAQKVFDERRATSLRDDPEARCMPQGVPKASTLPYPFEIVNASNKTLILFEMYSLRRQIFTDGRELPKDPKDYAQPSWMGYSVGKWDGDDFVVTTAGVNDQVWNIDLAGHPHSDALRITERYHRVDFGHMDVNVTIDDSKTYAKPWNMPVMRYTLLPDTDLFEFVCEKNIDPQHMGAK